MSLFIAWRRSGDVQILRGRRQNVWSRYAWSRAQSRGHFFWRMTPATNHARRHTPNSTGCGGCYLYARRESADKRRRRLIRRDKSPPNVEILIRGRVSARARVCEGRRGSQRTESEISCSTNKTTPLGPRLMTNNNFLPACSLLCHFYDFIPAQPRGQEKLLCARARVCM